jgi:hypothetical protein
VAFFESTSARLAADRGLYQVLAGRGNVDDKTRIWPHIADGVTRLFDRAKKAGVIRADTEPEDAAVILAMLGVTFSTGTWRRYLALLLDGLRATERVASLRTDLAMAREEIARLRTDNARLRHSTQRLLAQQLEQAVDSDLPARVDRLVAENHSLTEKLRASTRDNGQLRKQIRELEEDIAAARTALRRMIREQSTEIAGSAMLE